MFSLILPEPKLLKPLKFTDEDDVLHENVLPGIFAVGVTSGDSPLHIVVLKGIGTSKTGLGLIVTFTASMSSQPLSL